MDGLENEGSNVRKILQYHTIHTNAKPIQEHQFWQEHKKEKDPCIVFFIPRISLES